MLPSIKWDFILKIAMHNSFRTHQIKISLSLFPSADLPSLFFSLQCEVTPAAAILPRRFFPPSI